VDAVERTAVVPEILGYDAARARVLAAVTPLASEDVPFEAARGRALRSALVATHDLPPFRNSSMDGIAVRASDLRQAPVTLRVAGEIPAGRVAERPLGAGECMWIWTGAPLPEGADAVVPVEELDAPGDTAADHVRVASPSRPGRNLRDAGADLRTGETALAAGRELSAHDLGLAAALGASRLAVGRRPRVAVISTGDELLSPAEPLRPGAIRDSNRPMLVALLEESGTEPVPSRHLGDDPDAVAEAIAGALDEADVVITIGGVSAGAHDPVKVGITRVGGIALWRVAMKPGRPQAFGAPRGRLFFGLPGNPASVACVFEALVRPALRKLQGFAVIDRPRLRVHTAHAIPSRAGRTDFVRVTLAVEGGAWRASEAGPQVSGHLMPQARAHALLVVPEGVARLETGEEADVLLLRWPATS